MKDEAPEIGASCPSDGGPRIPPPTSAYLEPPGEVVPFLGFQDSGPGHALGRGHCRCLGDLLSEFERRAPVARWGQMLDVEPYNEGAADERNYVLAWLREWAAKDHDRW